ncbi:3-dehydroquinate synthase [Polluticoccus soli]|uniref:3-dehydroquinate synthase n=1 Tax=Polluticoccus soli TaxID=3034150 RepID=UPI0023E1C715|nr:3-dehydroquinate synthase [Flavipsychrobacter sp. JY13-12]
MQYSLTFPTGTVQYMLHSHFEALDGICDRKQAIIITDSNIAGQYKSLFQSFQAVITIPAGEKNKSLTTASSVITQLLAQKTTKKTWIIGVGGGVVTDIAGFVASVYMRGVPFGFVPTSLLGMVDAAIGGKNGVNLGLQKNLVGNIKQPRFILYDTSFLKTLPEKEWSNGFAEIIKYAMVFDERLFTELSKRDIGYYRDNPNALSTLIESCVNMKNKIVLADEQEGGARKLLNFGHTAGHAFETLYQLPHGYAVGLGMILACIISEKYGLHSSAKNKLAIALLKYQLPITLDFDKSRIMEILRLDKKGNADSIDFIMLQHIGEAVVRNIPFDVIENSLSYFTYASSH